MKLLRYGPTGREMPAMLDADGQPRDLSSVVGDIDAGAVSTDGLARIAAVDPATLPLVEGSPRIGPCVAGTRTFLAIGLNYHDHAQETGNPIPTEPILFMKATSSIAGPNDDLPMPRDATKLDWEAELGVVIGGVCRYVSVDEALDRVAGYCVVNDVSERAFQFDRGGQWVKGKSADGFGTVGPWLVTADEVGDPQALDIFLEVNGERCQSGTTANMIFGVAEIVSYVSRFMTLRPGDIVTTGTPAGVGHGRTPPKYLAVGDALRLGIHGLGEQHYNVGPPAS